MRCLKCSVPFRKATCYLLSCASRVLCCFVSFALLSFEWLAGSSFSNTIVPFEWVATPAQSFRARSALSNALDFFDGLLRIRPRCMFQALKFALGLVASIEFLLACAIHGFYMEPFCSRRYCTCYFFETLLPPPFTPKIRNS